MSKEVEEWWHCPTPQQDSDGHFHTEAPIIIFQMVDENLQVAKTVRYVPLLINSKCSQKFLL